jgi:hypothetical protein
MLSRARIDDSVSVTDVIEAAHLLVDSGVGTSALLGRAAPFPEELSR